MIYFCCDERRRNAVRDHATLNGIDFIEVLDLDAPVGRPRQHTLLVRFLKPVPDLTRDHVLVEGGERVTPVRVEWAFPASAIPAELITPEEQAFFAALPEAEHVLVVRTDSSGDFSVYSLRVVGGAASLASPEGFDRLLAEVGFSFKVECPSDFDCKPPRVCQPERLPEPDVDYLAKDYASFRRSMLDRMAMVMPAWRERNPADLGIALVELLAYVGDHLSYQQDAAATESYLGTARRRVSVRRHARLVDYFMHDGCNARVWAQVRVEADNVELQKGVQLLTQLSGSTERIPPGSTAYDQALAQGPAVFETMHEIQLFQSHNEMPLYTWGSRECCLPTGATRVTLRGHYADLKRGDVLILEEVLGPRTGHPEDADPAHRHAVRLTEVQAHGPVGDDAPLADLLNDQPITEVSWAAADALPFPLCISAVTDAGYLEDVSVALGNIVLADHGMTIEHEDLGEVRRPVIFTPASGGDGCKRRPSIPVFPRFRPRLKERPLTQRGTTFKTEIVHGQKQTRRLTFDPDAPAAAAFGWEMKNVLPAVTLNDETWQPRRDLLASNEFAREFVVEVEDDGAAYVRFGDDRNGSRPAAGTSFTATYRVGNGVAGHVGAEAIAHVVSGESAIAHVRNPLPARAGVEPEGMEDVRHQAPSAFRTQERAVTEADYAAVTARHSHVQQAEATFRWTGSWHTVFVTVDRMGGAGVDRPFKDAMREHLERFRMAGHDLQVDEPCFVSLEIAMRVCAKPGYVRADVKAALLAEFSNGILPDGRRGVFHPDNFSFGESVYLSRLYAAAQRVPGVASVHITKFQRQGRRDDKVLAEGRLELNRLEIARLDNDPNFVEHGVFALEVDGGT